jgi:hypothetical protein
MEDRKLLGTIHFSDRIDEYYCVRIKHPGRHEFFLKMISVFEDRSIEKLIDENELPESIRIIS